MPRGYFLSLLAVPAFPRGYVGVHGGAVGIDIALLLKVTDAGGDELDLAGSGLQAIEAVGIVGPGTPVGGILLPVFGEPAQRDRFGPVGLDGDYEIPLLAELLEIKIFGHIGCVVILLNPVELVLAFREGTLDTQLLRQIGVDVVIGLGLAKWLDALHLEAYDAVVAKNIVIGNIAGAVCKFGNIPALEVGAGGKDDVGEFCLALKPDGL